MGWTYPTDASLETMTGYVDRVASTLLASPETMALAKDWEALLERLDQEKAALTEAERAERRAGALLDVRDVRWDAALRRLSSEAFHASDKKADQPPYSLLFRITAKEAQNFGPNRATVYGLDLLAQAAAVAHPALAATTEEFRARNEALISANQALREAERVARTHAVRRVEFVEEVQALMDKTEYEVLKLFPGDDALLRAILAPTPRKRRSEPDPAAPADQT